MVQSTRRLAMLMSGLFVAAGCSNRDTSITHGADGEPEWSRRLAAAVPLGIAVDSARRILEGSGFRCGKTPDSASVLSCEKVSGKAVVQRRWNALVKPDSQRRVYEVFGSTGLSRP